MAIRPLSIPPLQERIPIVDTDRRPMNFFIRALNSAFRQIQSGFNDQAALVQQLAILAGIVDAQGDLIADQAVQIADLAAAQEASSSELSLQNSGVTSEAGPLTCSAAGTVTIANHTRTYGNATLNPPVSVVGDLVVTGFASGDTVFVFYDDPTRAGGAVTYQFSMLNDDMVQAGNRHAVGEVTVPAVGTDNGTYVRPR